MKWMTDAVRRSLGNKLLHQLMEIKRRRGTKVTRLHGTRSFSASELAAALEQTLPAVLVTLDDHFMMDWAESALCAHFQIR
jgi:hypothetical protein